MNEKKWYTSGRDICISIFLIATMILRIFTENATLFAVFAFVGFIAAVYDIYISTKENYGYYSRFLIVRGAFIIGCAICTIIVAIIVILNCSVSSLVVDELSILALLASLPRELHCRMLGNYIQNKEKNYE